MTSTPENAPGLNVEGAAVGAVDAPVGGAPAQGHHAAAPGHAHGGVGAELLAPRREQLHGRAAPAYGVGLRRRHAAAAGADRAGEGRRPGRLQQHAHALVRIQAPDRGVRVVVAEDVPVAAAVEREPVGAVLAHPHAVAEARAADRELRRGATAVPAGSRQTRAKARVRRKVRARMSPWLTATLARHDRRGEVSGNGAQGVGPVRGVPGGRGGQVRLRDPGGGDARPQRVARQLLCRLHPGST